jgi:hypothetical protein
MHELNETPSLKAFIQIVCRRILSAIVGEVKTNTIIDGVSQRL